MPARAALITALIRDRPMCVECISKAARMTTPNVESALETIAATLVLHRETGRCSDCGAMTDVLTMAHPTA